MATFYLTFGTEYGREKAHPRWSGANGAGWVRIEAPNENIARNIATEAFGTYYSTIRPAMFFDTSESRPYYALGEMLILTSRENDTLALSTPTSPRFVSTPGGYLGAFMKERLADFLDESEVEDPIDEATARVVETPENRRVPAGYCIDPSCEITKRVGTLLPHIRRDSCPQ